MLREQVSKVGWPRTDREGGLCYAIRLTSMVSLYCPDGARRIFNPTNLPLPVFSDVFLAFDHRRPRVITKMQFFFFFLLVRFNFQFQREGFLIFSPLAFSYDLLGRNGKKEKRKKSNGRETRIDIVADKNRGMGTKPLFDRDEKSV